MRALVTGGCGFIGSHLVDGLLAQGAEVTVFDRLSTGHREFLAGPLGLEAGGSPHPRFKLIAGDILDLPRLEEAVRGQDAVFHLAANADVRGGVRNTQVDVEQNILGTHRVLEAVRRASVPNLAFTSSAVIYGEPTVIPTPEDYRGPQTSLYGASKLSAEALLEAYSNYYGLRGWIFRFVSLIGERYTHGVVVDFVRKLKADPRELEILGDGKQRKSYLYVKDAVDGMLRAYQHHLPQAPGVHPYNLGHEDSLEATAVADLVCAEMGLTNVRYRFSGGSRGWPGDSPVVRLDTRRLRSLGWAPSLGVAEGIRRTTRYLLDHPQFVPPTPSAVTDLRPSK